MATGGRKLVPQLIHEISMAVTPAIGVTAPLSGVLGVVPAGAILSGIHFLCAVALNATTATLAIGTTVGGNQILAATDLKTPARTDTLIAAATMGPFGVDTPIYYTVTLTGPAPTAGVSVAWIDYLAGPG